MAINRDEPDQHPDQLRLSSAPLPSHVPDQCQRSDNMTDDKRPNQVQVHVEVCIKQDCTCDPGAIEVRVYGYVRDSTAVFRAGLLHFDDDPLLQQLTQYAYVSLPDKVECVPFWSAQLAIHVFQLSQDPVAEEMADNDEDVVACQIYSLPNAEFDQIWENLVFQDDIKQRLLNYASTAMHFADLGVNSKIMCLNRMILLHGPPGSGKTSLCAGLAQKLSIRLSRRYPHCQLVSINAHSLFSKWFSESGKLVLKLFQRIRDLISDSSSLLILLLDEVESLAGARQAALSGSEPSDSIRAVNALLTQLDQLRSYRNVFICCTSNLVEAIDVAFLDRADITLHIDSPSVSARFEILRSCLNELIRTGIIKDDTPHIASFNSAVADNDPVSQKLLDLSRSLSGASGRRLRRLPVQAHSLSCSRMGVDVADFILSMSAAVADPILSSNCSKSKYI